MLEWAFYRADTIDGIRTNINDDIIEIKNLTVEYTRTYRAIIPHPTITVIGKDMDWKDKYIFVTEGGRSDVKMVLYVESAEIEERELKTVLKCWDILHKLSNVRVEEFDQSFWSGYSPSQTDEFRYDAGSTSRRYITVPFLLRVMFAYVSESSVTAPTTTEYYYYDKTTYFVGYFSNGTSTNLAVKHLCFQWEQLQELGKTAKTGGENREITLLDVYLAITEIIGGTAHIRKNATGWEHYMQWREYINYTTPLVIGDKKEKDIKQYTELIVTYKRLAITEWNGNYSSEDFYEEKYPDEVNGFKLSLPESLLLFRLYGGQVHELTLYGGDTFAQQLQEELRNYYILKYKQVTSEVEETYTIEPIVTKQNIGTRMTEVTILEEV